MLGEGGGGGERNKHNSLYFTLILLSRIFENDKDKTGNFPFLSLPPSSCIFSFCFSFFISFFFFAPIVEVFILLTIEFVGPSSDVLKF